MTNIYLIRHAEAEGNLYRIAQGQCNSSITDRGYRQIAALAERFRDIHVDAVYSSDLYRTCATAEAICVPKGLPLHRCSDLREICVGRWEEKTWGEIARSDTEQMINFSRRLDLWHVEGAESTAQVRDRVLGALRRIAAENEGKTVAVFCHGCAIRIVLGTLQGIPLSKLGDTSHGDNTAVSLIEAEGGNMRVVYRDDNSHLTKAALSTFAKQTWWKRPNALEPGLYFDQIRLPEQGDWLCRFAGEAWQDSCDPRPLDAGLLLREAAQRPTLTGELEDGLVGLLQLNPRKEADAGRGWLSLYGIDRARRGRGYGIQLLGQAVYYYRRLGRETLCLAMNEKNEAGRRFFSDYGFAASGERTADGREVWSKDLRFRPLADCGE